MGADVSFMCFKYPAAQKKQYKGFSKLCFRTKDQILQLKATQLKPTQTFIFTFIAVIVFKLLSRKSLFINRKDNRNC